MEENLVLCDTNVLINWFKNDTDTIKVLQNISLSKIVLSSIIVMELLQGASNKKELLQIGKSIINYNVINFNEDVSSLAINLVEKYSLSHDLQIPDAIIGATAVVFKLPLFTYNIKDFRYIPNLKIYKI
jgi:predicted nucleic acid-binding protein